MRSHRASGVVVSDLQNPPALPSQNGCLLPCVWVFRAWVREGHRRHLQGDAEAGRLKQRLRSQGNKYGVVSYKAQPQRQLQEPGGRLGPGPGLIFPWGRGFSGQAGRDGWPGTFPLPARPASSGRPFRDTLERSSWLRTEASRGSRAVCSRNCPQLPSAARTSSVDNQWCWLIGLGAFPR